MARILIIDDDPDICTILLKLSEGLHHQAFIAHTLADGLAAAQSQNHDLVLLDLELPDGNGLQILPDLLKSPSQPEVIIITGAGDGRGAELAFKYGAWDFIPKPFLWEEVSLPITRAIQYRLEKEARKGPVTLNRNGIIGKSAALNGCLDDVVRACISDVSVLVTGESGTGKELFARAIHINSKRASRRFVPVDCGALTETLMESILFGHERGAFTGAFRQTDGLIKQAEGGTLFLDEIGELPFTMQRTLLRTLQEKSFLPLGADREVSVDFRLIAATNRDLDQMVQKGTFREDLLFRIKGIELSLPPLKSRKEDIEEIALNKIYHLGEQYGNETKGVSREFLDALQAQDWPGNVRELINALEYALASAGKDPTLYPKHLHPKYRAGMIQQEKAPKAGRSIDSNDYPDISEDFPVISTYRDNAEKRYLQTLLVKSRGDRSSATRLSGMSQSRLYALLKKHNLSLSDPV
ncbi:MAG: sigma-54-dependent Fis family transcriptional regulator [Desulfobacteraceae bacterium]|nr:MAG: sigma-54-dependent Fis family transcriptional regulator [Desulfobacteraceae bacterium]